MRFEHGYHGNTAVQSAPDRMRMSFAPDLKREPTFFRGNLRSGLEFREAISALHDVVVSDLRWRPKDREEYRAWLALRDQQDLAELLQQSAEVREQVRTLRDRLEQLNVSLRDRMKPFYVAQARYFDYLYKKDRDAWIVLDPVVTVHPDQVFFECFSLDESTYGRLSARYEEFRDVGEFACGTTNVDYSAALYDEFQKIRTYKTTALEVDPTGFAIQTTGDDLYKEVQIDLPDSWVRGFLQVSSAMTLPTASFTLHPMDLWNLLFHLRRRREKHGPRSLRYRLAPGRPVQVVLDPWNLVLECPRSTYQGTEEREIRVWGRRRLLTLERLVPVARSFTVHLLGRGMPSFYVADLGTMTFTLGLSGWTANDWSRQGNFDLMAPRATVDAFTARRVFEGLKETWFATPDGLARKLNLERATVLAALGMWAQAGRVIYDLDGHLYRVRELSREPLPMDRLRFDNEREQAATVLVDRKQVTLIEKRVDPGGWLRLAGTVTDSGRRHVVSLATDGDERLREGSCECSWHFRNKLRRGPCEHILALRMQFARETRRLEV